MGWAPQSVAVAETGLTKAGHCVALASLWGGGRDGPWQFHFTEEMGPHLMGQKALERNFPARSLSPELPGGLVAG